MSINSATGKWLVLYDFNPKPSSSAFWSVLDELVNQGGLKYVQKSVYIAKDKADALDLVALLEWYRASDIKAVPIGEGSLNDAADQRAAEARIAALHTERLKRRGRKPTAKRRKR